MRGRGFRIAYAIAASAALTVGFGSPSAAAPLYTITDLGTLGDAGSFANYVNRAGQVVGYTESASGWPRGAFVWNDRNRNAVVDPGEMVHLGALGGSQGAAQSIDDHGRVVGSAQAADGSSHAFLVNPLDTDGDGAPDQWYRDADSDGINDLMVDLGTCREGGGGSPWEGAFGINASGRVVATFRSLPQAVSCVITPEDTNGDGVPDRWYRDSNGDGENDLMTEIRTGLNGSFFPWAISDGGQVVGPVDDWEQWSTHAVVATPSGFSDWYDKYDLGTLGGSHACSRDVKDDGRVVGSAETATGEHHSFLVIPEDADGDGIPDTWFRDADGNGINDLMADLGTLPGFPYCAANGSNSSGQVVGYTEDSVYNHRGFLWDSGGIWDLTDLIPPGSGWDYLEIAQEINEAGQIVGSGWIGGQRHAFLMSPAAIPEPCTVLLFSAGLLALGRRRRKPSEAVVANLQNGLWM